jgi:hypothetical protein
MRGKTGPRAAQAPEPTTSPAAPPPSTPTPAEPEPTTPPQDPSPRPRLSPLHPAPLLPAPLVGEVRLTLVKVHDSSPFTCASLTLGYFRNVLRHRSWCLWYYQQRWPETSPPFLTCSSIPSREFSGGSNSPNAFLLTFFSTVVTTASTRTTTLCAARLPGLRVRSILSFASSVPTHPSSSTAVQGKTVDVKLTDRCEGCAYGDLDFSPHAFNQLADPSEGRITGISMVDHKLSGCPPPCPFACLHMHTSASPQSFIQARPPLN